MFSQKTVASDSRLQSQLFPGLPASWAVLQILDVPAHTVM